MTTADRILESPKYHELLQNYFNLSKVAKSTQGRRKFMQKFFSSVLERMLTAAGADSRTRA